MKFSLLIIVITPLILMSACVSTSKYDEAIADAESVRQSLGSAEMEIERNQQLIEKTRQELNAANMLIASAQNELIDLDSRKQDVQRNLMDAEKQLSDSQMELADSQAQMVTLRNIENETNRRNQIYGQFVNRLKSMIDGGQLTVSIEQGRIVINLPNNVLFKSGNANLNPEGEDALAKIAAVLSQFSDRRFQIEGHTDNKPIKSAKFPSNWELSTARALTVVHLLTDLEVAAENISAAGFAEFRPRGDNETEEGRQLNRRIEIVMLPNLDILSSELPKVIP